LLQKQIKNTKIDLLLQSASTSENTKLRRCNQKNVVVVVAAVSLLLLMILLLLCRCRGHCSCRWCCIAGVCSFRSFSPPLCAGRTPRSPHLDAVAFLVPFEGATSGAGSLVRPLDRGLMRESAMEASSRQRRWRFGERKTLAC